MRDFVNSRVKNGDPADPGPHHVPHERPADPLAVRLHEDRHPAGHVGRRPRRRSSTMGKAMATRNGYKAEQSSDLYITDGDQIDWLYGVHRIFSFTWELYPPETSTVWGDHYPADEHIAPQTARNRAALLYFLDIAGCPYRAIGKEKTALRPVPRRLRDQSRLDVQPVRNRHRRPPGRGPARDPEPTVDRQHPDAARRRRTPASSRWSPAARPTAAPAPTTSTAAPRRSARRRSRCPRRSGR